MMPGSAATGSPESNSPRIAPSGREAWRRSSLWGRRIFGSTVEQNTGGQGPTLQLWNLRHRGTNIRDGRVASLEVVCPLPSGRLRKRRKLWPAGNRNAHRTEDVHSEDMRRQTAWRRVVPCVSPSGCVLCRHGTSPVLISLVRPLDPTNKTCPYCEKQFTPLPSHPQQVVCSSVDCQRRRRAEYHRKKINKDPLYRALCEDSKQTWKQRNPDYMKQYRARRRKVKPDKATVRPSIAELKKLLTSVKNNVEKNTSAIRVTRCTGGVWLIAPKKLSDEKNNFAPTYLIVVRGIPLDE